MKYVFIINKFTVMNRLDYLCERIKLYCNNNNIDYIIEVNSLVNSTENILKKYKNTNYIIFSVGGDGMLNRVLNSIINTKNILGFIPFGTGNDFYKSARVQFNNGINCCDLIKINNKYFINTACFGIDADIANDGFVGSKFIWLKKYKYIINLIKHFLSFKCKFFEVSVNEKKYIYPFVTIVLTNGQFYGSGFNIGPYSKLNNGKFDVYLVKKLNKFKMIKLILKMKNGKHEDDINVIKYTVDKIKINSKNRVCSNIDGESIEAKPFNVEVAKKKLQVYYDKNIIDFVLK